MYAQEHVHVHVYVCLCMCVRACVLKRGQLILSLHWNAHKAQMTLLTIALAPSVHTHFITVKIANIILVLFSEVF